MNNISYNRVNYSKFDVNSVNVLIKKLTADDLKCRDGIYIPESEKHKNLKIGVGQVIDIGNEVDKKLGVKVGDYVMYDYYSAHGDWPDHIITNCENLIMSLTEEEAFKFVNN